MLFLRAFLSENGTCRNREERVLSSLRDFRLYPRYTLSPFVLGSRLVRVKSLDVGRYLFATGIVVPQVLDPFFDAYFQLADIQQEETDTSRGA